jgi:ATPase subunit of ABC transporter with duplicated ATPase domains
MLQVNRVSKTYGIHTVLDEVSLIVNRGERVGLVGPNGCGKTTLLRVIAGLERPDAGRVTLEPGASLGYLAQGLDPSFGDTVGQVVRSGIAGWAPAHAEAERLAARLSTGDAAPDALEAYGEALSRFEALGGYAIEHRVDAVLDGLGLDGIDPDRPVERLSGGQRTRVGLARLLIAEPSLLLLDEPTNHLDIEALEWLEEFIGRYDGAVLIVSHDRAFLDNTVSRIVALDDRTHRTADYPGNYSDYELARLGELEAQWSAWQDQQVEITQLQTAARHMRDIARFRVGGKGDSGDKFAKGFFANRAKGTVARARHLEARLDRLLNEDRIDKPKQGWQMKLDFGPMTRGGQIVLALEDLGHAFGGPFLFRHTDLTLRHAERVALIGPNGTGKTTLLRIITGELEPAEGRVRLGSNVRLGYMPQEQNTLDPRATPLSTVQESSPMSDTEARNFLHYFLFEGDEVFTPVPSLSYGERARLILARLVLDGANCLVLDEPINHLDIPSRQRFEAALDAFPGAVLAATHDRAFIDRFAAAVWAIRAGGGPIRRFLDWEEMQRMSR